jgi:hypothetical protein
MTSSLYFVTYVPFPDSLLPISFLSLLTLLFKITIHFTYRHTHTHTHTYICMCVYIYIYIYIQFSSFYFLEVIAVTLFIISGNSLYLIFNCTHINPKYSIVSL